MTRQNPTLRIGLIGSGGRGVGGYVKFFENAPVRAEVVAIADPSKENVDKCLAKVAYQTTTPTVYSDWRTMLDAESGFDAMLIATPNYLHHAPALASLDKGIRALGLEKPLATTPQDCLDIVRKADARGVPVQLGFVFRSAPFFHRVKELLDGGTIGTIVSIQLDELVSPRTSSVNFRSPWRRYTALGGGSLLEKSCHDMDLLNWLAGSRPVRVSSFGGKAIFRPNTFLPMKCDAQCPIAAKCIYYCGRKEMDFGGDKKVEKVCVYNSGADVADHQSVQISYQNRVVANFMLNFNTANDRSGRNLHIVGTHGRIWGHEVGKVVMVHDLETDKITEHPLPVIDPSGGHGGGDRPHAEEFLSLAAGKTTRPVASDYDAYLSAMLCFAADLSREERRQVGIRYPALREIALA